MKNFDDLYFHFQLSTPSSLISVFKLLDNLHTCKSIDIYPNLIDLFETFSITTSATYLPSLPMLASDMTIKISEINNYIEKKNINLSYQCIFYGVAY